MTNAECGMRNVAASGPQASPPKPQSLRVCATCIHCREYWHLPKYDKPCKHPLRERRVRCRELGWMTRGGKAATRALKDVLGMIPLDGCPDYDPSGPKPERLLAELARTLPTERVFEVCINNRWVPAVEGVDR